MEHKTDNEILDDYELIAEFMDFKLSERGNNWKGELNGETFYTDNLIVFQQSWDCIMPVVERIESLPEIGVVANIHKNFTEILVSSLDGRRLYEKACYNSTSKISHVYDSTVSFIKWYNEQNK